MHPWEDVLFSYLRGSRNLIPNAGKSIEFISWFVAQDQLGWMVRWITHPNLCITAFHTHFPLQNTVLSPPTVL